MPGQDCATLPHPARAYRQCQSASHPKRISLDLVRHEGPFNAESIPSANIISVGFNPPPNARPAQPWPTAKRDAIVASPHKVAHVPAMDEYRHEAVALAAKAPAQVYSGVTKEAMWSRFRSTVVCAALPMANLLIIAGSDEAKVMVTSRMFNELAPL